jgi:acetoacetyl-CoA synthetase
MLFVVVGHGTELTPDLERRLRGALREAPSPPHVPNEVVAAPAVPRTLTGKKLEVPVRRLLLGHAVEKVVSRDSLANPAGLDWYDEFARSFLARRPASPDAP